MGKKKPLGAPQKNPKGGAPHKERVLQRQPSTGMGGIATTTVSTTWEYRVQLRLGSIENLFPEDVTTPLGKKMRLQVLGMFNRPLNHAAAVEVQDCLDVSWRHFKQVLYPSAPGTPRTEAQAEAHILTLLDDYLMQGATLPPDGQFARMYVPGGFPVFYSVSEPQATAGSPYRLGGDRFQIERAFYADNPILGKIPIVATVDRRTRDSPWQRAPAGIDVYFQLIPPDGISGTAAVRGGSLAAKPAAYFDKHIRGYEPSDGADPQVDNVHWHLGGKRKLCKTGVVGGEYAWNYNGRACRRENIFNLASITGFNAAHGGGRVLPHPPFPIATLPAVPASHPNAVTARTNADGEAGVIFEPSLIGGDRYKLRAYVGAAQPANNVAPNVAVTGTMVRWRTIRMSYYVQNRGAASQAELPTELQGIIAARGAGCTHHDGSGLGRYCLQCMQREGQVDTVNFGPGSFIANELAKSFCQFIVEPSAANPLSMNDPSIKKAMKAAVAAVAADPAAMTENVYGEDLKYKKNFFQNAYPFQLAYGNIVPGSVIVQINYTNIATDDSRGGFTNLAGKLSGGSGSINYATGQIVLKFKFGNRPAEGTAILVTYTTTQTFDLNALVYYPPNSPFLFNLRTPDDYNANPARPRLRSRYGKSMMGIPASAYIGVKNTLLGNKILPRFLKEIADNRGVGTGLVLVQSPNFETWEGLWPSDCGPTMNGKGIASGYMVLQGNYFRTGSYTLPIDSVYAAYGIEPLALHEMGHCLYMEHSPPVAGGKGHLHDWIEDVCVMGYAPCDGDFCGQCVASYMGMNTQDERFRHEANRTNSGADPTKANLTSYYTLDPSG